MSLKLNHPKVIQNAFILIPEDQIPLISQNFPINFLNQFFHFVSIYLKNDVHYSKALKWTQQIFKYKPLPLINSEAHTGVKQI